MVTYTQVSVLVPGKTEVLLLFGLQFFLLEFFFRCIGVTLCHSEPLTLSIFTTLTCLLPFTVLTCNSGKASLKNNFRKLVFPDPADPTKTVMILKKCTQLFSIVSLKGFVELTAEMIKQKFEL